MTTRPLTDQQQRVLTFLEDFSREKGFPPTLREIGEAIGLTNVNAVRGHVTALEKKGYIAKEPDKARSIRILHAPSPLSRLKRKLHKVLRTDEGVFHRIVMGLAWSTWRARTILEGPPADWIVEALQREAVERGWNLLDFKVRPDHVRVAVEIWPNHSAEQTVRRFQAAGLAVMRRRRRELTEKRLWGFGYVATSDPELIDELVERLLSEQSDKGQ